MLTGQISSHARHDVQAQSSSLVTRSNIQFEGTGISASTERGGETSGEPVRAMTSPVLSTISRGSRGFPVAFAGQTLVQRPHIVQASVSSNCFQVNSSILATPNDSISVSRRFGMAFMAPFGRSRSLRYMLSGEVKMCRSIVVGNKMRNAMNDTTWASHHP